MRSPDFNDCRRVLDNWNQSHSEFYRCRWTDLEWNLTSQKHVRYIPTRLAGVAVIVAVATKEGERAGLSARSLWLSLWSEIPAGEEAEFIGEFADFAAREDKTRLSIGADEFHFVSGVPQDSESGLRFAKALRDSGFQGEDVVDFVGQVNSAAVQAIIDESKVVLQDRHWSWQEVEAEPERRRLAEFLQREFAGRWLREFEFWRESTDTRRAFWMVLSRADEIIGFARLSVRGRMVPLSEGWSPCALRLPLAVHLGAGLLTNQTDSVLESDSSLGPIGLAQSLRGQGGGRALLGQVLGTLQSRNAGRVCIDWTNAIKYYYPLQFAQVRKFWTAAKG